MVMVAIQAYSWARVKRFALESQNVYLLLTITRECFGLRSHGSWVRLNPSDV